MAVGERGRRCPSSLFSVVAFPGADMVSLPDGAELLGTFTKATCPVPGHNRHHDRLTRRDVPDSEVVPIYIRRTVDRQVHIVDGDGDNWLIATSL
jgi:hypothetical protein